MELVEFESDGYYQWQVLAEDDDEREITEWCKEAEIPVSKELMEVEREPYMGDTPIPNEYLVTLGPINDPNLVTLFKLRWSEHII